jgi:hypothetical protein
MRDGLRSSVAQFAKPEAAGIDPAVPMALSKRSLARILVRMARLCGEIAIISASFNGFASIGP